jgi:hypothetical protein
MPKTACPSDGVDLLNQRRWRGVRLCHHIDGIWKVDCALRAVSQLIIVSLGHRMKKIDCNINLR